MKQTTLVISLFFVSFFSYSQLYFNTLPENKQLIGRDLSTNQGLLTINGTVNNGPYYDITYDSWKSGEPNNSPAPENVGEINKIFILKYKI